MDATQTTDPRPARAPLFWLIAHQLQARSEAQRLDYIHTGFPPDWVKAVREAFRLEPPRLERLLNASTSTLERRLRHRQPLGLVSSERLERLASIAVEAAAVFGDHDAACVWMATRHSALHNQSPLQLCETEIGARSVWRLLSGMAASVEGIRGPLVGKPTPTASGQNQNREISDTFNAPYPPPTARESCRPAVDEPPLSPRSGQCHG
jgi:putative toxin-antitoxin system antitoxin component (TIGR02293 family)